MSDPFYQDLVITGALAATGVLFFLAGLAFDRIRIAFVAFRWLNRQH